MSAGRPPAHADQRMPPDHSVTSFLPKNFLRPCLLLLLREQPAHGYELLERLRPLGFNRDDPGRLYRVLRALEQDGLVRSVWEKSSSGPDRRTYELTDAGTDSLHESAGTLAETGALLAVFMDRYAQLPPPTPTRRPRARRTDAGSRH